MNVPAKNSMCTWISVQRVAYKDFVRERKGEFVKYNYRIKLLEDIGIDLDPFNLL